MPGYDRKGPMGEGPRTGRARGHCGSERDTATSDRLLGRGRGAAWRHGGRGGRGWGLGRGGGLGPGFGGRWRRGVGEAGDRDWVAGRIARLEAELDELRQRDVAAPDEGDGAE